MEVRIQLILSYYLFVEYIYMINNKIKIQLEYYMNAKYETYKTKMHLNSCIAVGDRHQRRKEEDYDNM